MRGAVVLLTTLVGALDVRVSCQELHLGMLFAAIGAVFVGTACETTIDGVSYQVGLAKLLGKKERLEYLVWVL